MSDAARPNGTSRPQVSWILRLDGSKSDGDGVVAEGVDTATASPAQLAAMTGFIRRFGGTAPVYSNPPSYTFNQLCRVAVSP